jgi:hypothetical protein
MLHGNYSRSDIVVQNNTSTASFGSANNDGDNTYSGSDFANGGGFYWTDTTTVNWNFTDGTGDWKWLPSGTRYNYPVLQWQTAPPNRELIEDINGFVFDWP